jgi:ABC-type spermidine/putrescine transport system permease subunit II
MEEAAQNLGASGLAALPQGRVPLALPGYIAGASLVFIKVFDDLGHAAGAERHQHAGAPGLPARDVDRLEIRSAT